MIFVRQSAKALRVRTKDGPTVGLAAEIEISARPPLARALEARIATAVRAAAASFGAPPRVVSVRSRKGARDKNVQDACVVVAVTRRNARHLVALVEILREKSPRGIQLVWDGTDRDLLERHVFAALEHGRASPRKPPVVLSTDSAPVAALRFAPTTQTPSPS